MINHKFNHKHKNNMDIDQFTGGGAVGKDGVEEQI